MNTLHTTTLRQHSRSLFYGIGLSLGLAVSGAVFAQQQMAYTYNDLGIVETVALLM